MPNHEGSSRSRGPRSDARRNDRLILEAAARVLADDPKATMQRVADEAGVVRLTVYRRYPNRDALRRAIFEAAAVEARQLIDDAGETGRDAVTSLRAIIAGMAAIACRYPLLSVGTDLQPLPHHASRPASPPAAKSMQDAMLALVRRGQQSGELRADLPAELLPQAVVGTLRIALRFARSLHSDPALVGAKVADLLLNGFVSHTGLPEPGAPGDRAGR